MTPDSQTLSPLPEVLSRGLIAVSTFGVLSFLCSGSLFLYLTSRIIKWRRGSEIKAPLNQFLFLIYNLLLADIKQGLAFALNIAALRRNAIDVGTATCWAQGWFISTGDLASSAFICAIACHTFLGVVKDYRLPTKVFYTIVGGIWVLVYLMAALGPLMNRRDFYVRASAWCWISEDYASERLWLHYFWIFIFMFTTVLIYTIIFTFLRHRISASSGPYSASTSHSATPLMILYPFIYVVCTAPLAAGRISALAGNHVSLDYFCAAGSMIACNGWLDVLLYASTRANILFTEHPPGEDVGLDTFAFMGKGHRFGTTTTIEAGERVKGRMARRSQGGDSVEHLYGLDRIGVKGEVTVTVDIEPHGFVRRDRIGSGSGVSRDSEDVISRRSGAIDR